MQSRKWTNHPKFAIETALAGGLALGGVAAWPLLAPAQQSAMPVIGLLHSTSFDATPSTLGFRRGLAEIGS
jgi:hypothetical protein